MTTFKERAAALAVENNWTWREVDDGPWGIDYLDLFTGRGLTVLLSSQFGSWQGDYAVVVSNPEGQFAMTVFGYGSCSGCDALEGAETWEDIEVMADSFSSNLTWFNSPQEVYEAAAAAEAEEAAKYSWYEHDSEYPVWVEGELKAWALGAR